MLRDYRVTWDQIPRYRRHPEQLTLRPLISEVLEQRIRNWVQSRGGGELTDFRMMGSHIAFNVRSYLPQNELRRSFSAAFRGQFKNLKIAIEAEDDLGDGFRVLYGEMTDGAFDEWRTQARFRGAS